MCLRFCLKSTLKSAQTASAAGASTSPLYTALSSWPSVAATRVVAAAAPTTLVAVRAISAMLEMGESRMMASTGRPAAANRAVMESDGRLLQNATSFAISQWIQYAKRAAVHTHSGSCCLSIFYFAYSTARLSRMTLTLIWPGYSSSDSIFFVSSRARMIMLSSETSSGLTMIRTSRPA